MSEYLNIYLSFCLKMMLKGFLGVLGKSLFCWFCMLGRHKRHPATMINKTKDYSLKNCSPTNIVNNMLPERSCHIS